MAQDGADGRLDDPRDGPAGPPQGPQHAQEGHRGGGDEHRRPHQCRGPALLRVGGDGFLHRLHGVRGQRVQGLVQQRLDVARQDRECGLTIDQHEIRAGLGFGGDEQRAAPGDDTAHALECRRGAVCGRVVADAGAKGEQPPVLELQRRRCGLDSSLGGFGRRDRMAAAGRRRGGWGHLRPCAAGGDQQQRQQDREPVQQSAACRRHRDASSDPQRRRRGLPPRCGVAGGARDGRSALDFGGGGEASPRRCECDARHGVHDPRSTAGGHAG
jgi:hypothetical protein